MNTIYLLSPGTRLLRSGNRLLIKRHEETLSSVPILMPETIIADTRAHIDSTLLLQLLCSGCNIIFIDWQGHIKLHLSEKLPRTVKILRQLRYFSNNELVLPLIRKTVTTKIQNQYEMLRGYKKYHHLQKAETALPQLRLLREKADTETDPDTLRGFEGMAARLYFDSFADLFDSSEWPFNGRSQHPARDEVNALLNFGYAFLEREVRIAVAATGLDAETGFFHTNNGRKDSLIFDLMEPFRQPVIDRFIITALHRHLFLRGEFSKTEEGIRIGSENLHRFCTAYENYMEKPYAAYGGKPSRELLRTKIKLLANKILENNTPEEYT